MVLDFWFGFLFCFFLVFVFGVFLRFLVGWGFSDFFFFLICMLRPSADDLNGVVPIYINSVDTYLAVD